MSNFEVMISLNEPFFKTHQFLSSKTVSVLNDASIVYVPLSYDGFKTLFTIDKAGSTLDNAQRLLENLANFFDPSVYNNNYTFATQLATILTDMHSDILVNVDKIAADMTPNGPLFNYFFKSRSTQYSAYEQDCFENTMAYQLYDAAHDPSSCDFCSVEIAGNTTSGDCESFYNDMISGSDNSDILYSLASQLKGMITLYEENHDGTDFYDSLSPTDSISIQSTLFIPSSENNNNMNLIIKFHMLKPRYTF